jgi:CHAD domain-containing protein
MSEDLKVNLTDTQLLEDLLESEKLNEEEEEAFQGMLRDLTSRKYTKLTPRQRDWAEKSHKRLNLDPGAVNLVSSGKVKVTEEERKGLQEFVSSLGPKKLRPPGR